MSEPPEVFISYRSCDRELAEGLYERLRAEGFSVWYDRERSGEDAQRLMPGCRWYTEIEQGVENSRVILPVLTPEWKGSEWTRFETYGHDCIIPLLFRGEWTEVSTPPLEGLQVHDFRSPDDRDWQTLLAAIREELAEEPPEKAPRLALIPAAVSTNPNFVGREQLPIEIH